MATLRTRSAVAAAATVLAVCALAAPAAAEPGEQVDPPSWGLDRVDQRDGGDQLDQLYRYETTAADVTAYVIDTGVDGTHPDFGGRVWPGRDFVDDDEHATDRNGHGTQLAGVIAGERYGIAKQARVMPVRVLDAQGGGSAATILAGIEWVLENAKQPAVAVLGIGGPPNEVVDEAVRRLTEVMPVAVPAGGSGSDAGEFSPGRVPEVLTVAAANQSDEAAPKSNSGAAVDLYAPGVDILAPATGGKDARRSGTSMAAAHVAGAAALYRARHPDTPASEVSAALVANATEGALSGVPEGTANRLLYTLTPETPDQNAGTAEE
ncbi:S8 family peptidase [Amycolatopsis aidingensis]|uniref:S8 family peptidase n=1 Tax=Amycolatopsis aidingensis TaxID=2842453 RepID=UPI001C0E440A|nr:S8 family peptidase [Amycolatopsis aidingensis]